MTKFTVEQAKAISSRGEDLLLSASAGTGKTAVLIERVASLIVDDARDIDEFLIVTFTEKAAAELKTRLAGRLAKELEGDGAHIERLSSQIEKLENADISTIHSFCKRLISEKFQVIDLEPGLKAADSVVSGALISEVLDELMRKNLEKDELPLVFAAYGDVYDNYTLRNMIIALYRKAQVDSSPRAFLENMLENSGIDLIEKKALDLYSELIVAGANYLENCIHLVYSARDCADSIGAGEYADTCDNDARILETALNSIRGIVESKLFKDDVLQALIKIDEVLDGFKLHKLNSMSKSRKEEIGESEIEKFNKKRKAYNTSFQKDLEKYFMFDPESLKYDLEISFAYSRSLAEMTLEFFELYSEKKLALKLIDFDDMLHFAYDILVSEDAALSYREKYNYVFVDEYQDTSDIQDAIISRVAKLGSLFMVGDYKQSIYAFRGARPQLFLDKYKRFSSSEGAQTIELNRNFRSLPHVLDAVNQVFSKLMREDFGGIEYRKTAMLASGRDLFEQSYGSSSHKRAVLRVVDSENLKEESETSHLMGDYRSEEELLYISLIDRIKAMKSESYPVFDESKNEFVKKNYDYGDICVLMESPNKKAADIKKLFKEFGVPLSIDIEENLFDYPEITSIIDFLTAVCSPQNDIAMLSVMRSPIGAFDDDELFSLSKLPRDCYADLLREDFKTDGLEEKTEKKLSELSKRISEFRKNDGSSLREKLSVLLDECNYRYYLLGRRGGYTLHYAIDDFLSYVDEFETSTNSGLFAFVRHVKELEETGGMLVFTSKGIHDSNSVKLLSIHKSKGLQFPAVIFLDVQKKFNFSQNDAFVVSLGGELICKNVHRDKGISFKNSKFDLESERLQEEQLLEEMRKLYVALTRAEYHLELYCKADYNKLIESIQQKSVSRDFLTAKSMLEWILLSFSQDVLKINRDKGYDNLSFEIGSAWTVCESKLKERSESVLSTEKLPDVLSENFKEYDYPKIPTGRRRTVSQLKEEASEGIKLFKPAKRVKLNKNEADQVSSAGSSALSRGNAYHSFMQYYLQSKVDLTSFLEENRRICRVSDRELELIDLEDMRVFETTKLRQRIANSNRLWYEKPFVYLKDIDGEPNYIQGIIDLAFVENDEIVIVDYKTDRVRKEQDLIDRYLVQLALYAEAVQNITGLRVKEKLIYSFALGRSISLE